MHVLLVADDRDLLDTTSYALRRDGFSVLTAIDGQQALQRVEMARPDIVLLDIDSPRLHGLEVCRRIRQRYNTAIILLTDHLDEDEMVRGFQLGADDCVVKPFSVRQLIARIKAVLRRYRYDALSQAGTEMRTGDLHLDLQSHRATRGGVRVQLTPLEFRILHMLAMNEGRIIPYARLVEWGWGYEGGDSNRLRTHIYHIRQKLRLSPKQADGIRAAPRIGYRYGRG